MSSATDRPSWDVAEADEVLARLRAAAEPCRGALLMVVDPPVVVWANAAADAAFGSASSAAIILEGVLGQALGRLDAAGGERFERLRIFNGIRARVVTATFRRMRLGSGRQVDVVTLPEAEAGEDARAWDVSVLPLAGRKAEPPRAVSPEVAVFPPSAFPSAEDVTIPWAPARCLWWTDATDRILRVEADVEVSGQAASLVGELLPALFAARGCDPDGLLAKACESRTTWSGLRLTWPVARNGLAPDAVLGAVPVWGPARDFQGYRGYASLDPTRLTPLAPPPQSIAEPIGEPVAHPVREDTASEPLPPVEPLREGPASETSGRVSTGEGSPPAPPSPMISGPYSSKVVVLRPFQAVAPLSGAAVLSDVGRLSPSERSAFAEIGLALGAAPDVGAAPSGAVPSIDALMAALPFALWVEGEGTPPRANRAFLDLTAYASADDLAGRGGIAHLLGGAHLPVTGDGVERTFSILDAHGRAVAVEGRGADSGGLTVLTVRRVEPHDTETMAEVAEDGLALLGPDGVVRRINRAGEHAFGRPRADLVGQDLPSLVAAESRGEALAFVAGLTARDTAAPTSFRLRRPDGSLLRVLASGRGLGAGWFGVSLRDDTIAERLDHALAEVSRLKQGKADFLAKLSHDLRTPLNGILGFAEVILDERFGPIGTARYRDYLLDIHQSGTHVLTLISDMLDLSRMETGRLEVSLTPVDVNRVVAESVAQLQADAHRERVIMRTSLPPRLPAALVDEAALRQMLAHVLSNAVRFNEPGGQVIVSTALSDTGAVAIRVRDTGVGMSDAQVAAATDPFRQAPADQTLSNGGNGFGLPITLALAEANGASMTIRSREQEGTLVELVLRVDPGQPVRVPAA